MALTIDDDRRDELLRRIRGFWLEEFDEEMTEFRAERVLEFVMETLGPGLFNQGVLEARRFISARLEDLESEVWEPEGTV